MEARATQKHIRVSPQKARLVVDLIRGKNAGEALSILTYTKKRVTGVVEKVLRSAIANAEQKAEHVDVDQLVVSKAYVNEGPRSKRIRPAPMGRAFHYQRRMSHITVVVESPEK
ncbi:MAG: 50S ribosomal protein L22 [Terriglobia bacterium]|jgi:large subunit ribosomal protein L22